MIVARSSGKPASKPRPWVVVQTERALIRPMKITACPMTTGSAKQGWPRPLIRPTAMNGLQADSYVEVDWIYTFPIGDIAGQIGTISDADLTEVDEALRLWLDL